MEDMGMRGNSQSYGRRLESRMEDLGIWNLGEGLALTGEFHLLETKAGKKGCRFIKLLESTWKLKLDSSVFSM